MKSLCLFQGATAEHTGPLTSANPPRCFYQNKDMRFTILVESLVKHNAYGPICIVYIYEKENDRRQLSLILSCAFHGKDEFLNMSCGHS